ncbi:MAG TPA: alpha/beta hydrolase [Rubrobacteraceae bacterium]|nr:alpha/beta hydrolase [Rubrobacteraceae bacterium]
MERGLWTVGSVPGEVRLAFGRTGEGADPILAMHGITAQHRAFNSVARHLRHPDGMVALDLRGRGNSEKPPSGYGLDAHAQDAIRTLDHLGIQRGTLVGHSMGAFVAVRAALLYPGRVRAFVLLDGGWPQPEEPSEPDEEVQEGLERAYSRLDMVFETPEDYLDFWFPDQNLTIEDLPSDLADYYLYDLERVDGGFTPKASREAVDEDANSVFSESPTAAVLKGIGCPAALVRAAKGFFPGSKPLIPDAARNAMAEALDLRLERLLPGANHYTMLFQEFGKQVANTIDNFLQQID